MSAPITYVGQTPDSQNVVLDKLMVLAATMSEALKDFTSLIESPNGMKVKEEEEFYFNIKSDSTQGYLSPSSNKGTPNLLPIAAFQPLEADCTQSAYVNHEYTSVAPIDYFSNDIQYDSSSCHSFDSCAVSVKNEDDLVSEPSSTTSTEVSNECAQDNSKCKQKRTGCKRACQICHKMISRDMTRHLRTHNTSARFQCVFPHVYCRHRSGRFNRPYDFKKHLLNYHFKYDDPNAKKLPNLTDKLKHIGTCSCGFKFNADDWLNNHILTNDRYKRCPYIDQAFNQRSM